MWWSRKIFEDRIDRLDVAVSQSFTKVREDTNTLYQWMNYFYQQNRQLHGTIQGLRGELQRQPTPLSRGEVKDIVDKDFERIFERIKRIEEKIDHIEAKRAHALVPEQPKTAPKIVQRRPALEKKIVRKVARNSKAYIKNIIKSIIVKYEEITALQLREMIVEEQGLCSKSSFYRLLDELERDETLNVIVEGREKVYFSKKNITV